MSANTKQIFHGITRAIFARLRKKASKIGIRVATPPGSRRRCHQKSRFAIRGTTKQLLEVECKAPFWINSSQVKPQSPLGD